LKLNKAKSDNHSALASPVSCLPEYVRDNLTRSAFPTFPVPHPLLGGAITLSRGAFLIDF
jgi:hypothetical protein